MAIFDPLPGHHERPGHDATAERRGEERRQAGDRRSGLDRRDQGVSQPLRSEPRPYGFREFTPRRSRQDRRIYRRDGEGWDRRSGGIEPADREALRSLLTEEEIRYLLRCGYRGQP